MLIQEVTPEMVKAWKVTFDQYRPKMSPNKKQVLKLSHTLNKNIP